MTTHTHEPSTDFFDADITDSKQSMLTELVTLGKVIRQGLQPDSPELLQRYWVIGSDYAKTEPKHTFAVYFLLFKTLFNTASDKTLHTHWREVCMNHIYRPLFAMQKVSYSAREKRYVRDLRRTLAARKFF